MSYQGIDIFLEINDELLQHQQRLFVFLLLFVLDLCISKNRLIKQILKLTHQHRFTTHHISLRVKNRIDGRKYRLSQLYARSFLTIAFLKLVINQSKKHGTYHRTTLILWYGVIIEFLIQIACLKGYVTSIEVTDKELVCKHLHIVVYSQ